MIPEPVVLGVGSLRSYEQDRFRCPGKIHAASSVAYAHGSSGVNPPSLTIEKKTFVLKRSAFFHAEIAEIAIHYHVFSVLSNLLMLYNLEKL